MPRQRHISPRKRLRPWSTRPQVSGQPGVQLALAVCAVVGSLGCTCADSDEAANRESSPLPKETSTSVSDPSGKSSGRSTTVVSLFDERDRCLLLEDGLILDLGSDAAESSREFQLIPEPAPQFEGLLGESFRKLDQLSNDFVFWLPEDVKDVAFQAQIHGRESDRVAAYIDGKRLGAARLKQDETRVVEIGGRSPVEKGRHKLRVSLSRQRGSSPSADISWVRIGEPGWRKEAYPATRRQVFSEVTIGETRHRALVLQPGARVRCPLWLPKNARLETEMGLWGSGAGEGEIAIISQDDSRVVLGGQRREKDDFRDFSKMTLDLSKHGDQLVELEFVSHPKGDPARVTFASPTVVTRETSYKSAPQARRAVVIVLGGLDEMHEPPSAGEHGLPFLNQFARDAISFPHYRVTSTSVPAIIGSLLTGVSPVEHGITAPPDRLSSRLRTLASAVESAGGRSAFFTGVPSSFAEFGFDRGFERFKGIPPQADEPAEKPLLDAAQWLDSAFSHEGPVFTVVHLRGGHPPFDVSRDDARKLPPEEYGGDFSARRAAIQLGDIRARRYARHRHMPAEDWIRLGALRKEALLRQSAALTAFLSELKNRGVYDDTLLIVMGDVNAGQRPLIPFAPDAPLLEQYLAAPLLIKFAGDYRRGSTVEGTFAPRDISYTIGRGLGLEWLDSESRIDLGRSDAVEMSLLRPHVAYRDHAYSVSWGPYLLWGEDGKAPRLCLPEIDPGCQSERSESHAALARSLWMTTFGILSSGLRAAYPPEEQEPDEEFQNSLIVWGVAR